jgi:MerR family mercuric resistance operon transcriptional regulator
MTRGEVARVAGCGGEAVRFYEKAGLLPVPPRTLAGHRVYGPEHARRLRFIVHCRVVGFPLEAVRDLLDLIDRGAVTCAEVEARARAHLGLVRRKRAELARMEQALETLIARCDGRQVPDCPLIEALLVGAGPDA